MILYASILFAHSFGIIELQSAGQKLPDTISWRLIEDLSVYNAWSPATWKQWSSQISHRAAHQNTDPKKDLSSAEVDFNIVN